MSYNLQIMKKLFSFGILSLFIFASSCSSPTTSDIEEQIQEPKVILNNSNLSHRLNEGNLGVIGVKEAPNEDPGSINGKGLISGGNFYMSGSLAQGSVYNKWNSFNINNNATLYVEGNLWKHGS